MCDGCEQKGACGSYLDTGIKTVARVRNPVAARPGDAVEIRMADGVIVWGAAVIYLVPLAVMLGAISAALTFRDELGITMGENLLAVAAGTAGLLISLPVVRLISTRWKYLSEGTPVITRVLPREKSG